MEYFTEHSLPYSLYDGMNNVAFLNEGSTIAADLTMTEYPFTNGLFLAVRNESEWNTRIIPGSSHPYILKLPYTWTGAFVEVDRDSLYAFKADSLMSGRIQKEVADAVKNNGRVAYRVRSGDYLGKIAIRYGVTVSQIKSWNNLRSSNIRVGQILYIYARKTPAPEPTSSSSKSSVATVSGNTTYTTYTVKSGDALYNIAKLYPGVSAEDIKAANGMKSNRIMPGQVLKIPSK